MVLLFVSISFIFPSIAPPPPPPPHPPTPSLPAHELSPLLSTLHSHPFHLSFSLHLCLSVSSPSLPPVLSFPAKRLAGVFSTVVTFRTECHHCLSHSLSSLPLTCLYLYPLLLLLHTRLHPHPPAGKAFWTKCCA